MNYFRTLTQTLCVALAALSSAHLLAQTPANYPNKPVKIVVGYAPGGAVDVVARTLGQSLGTQLGQSFIIENKPGAGTNIAVKSVITAEPDGYTLMLAANALAANMALYQPMPFDAEKELTAISLVGRVPVVIAANPNAPFSSVAKLIEAAKAKPGQIAFASPGNGSTPHMAIEFFAKAAGIDLQHIPYKGGSPAITDAIGGQLPLVAVNALEVLPHVKSGKLKILAVLSPTRSVIYPDVPTIAESGFPGFEASVWYGLMAPTGTPVAIINQINAATNRTLASPELQKKLEDNGAVVMRGTAADFGAFMTKDHARWGEVIRKAGITTNSP